MVQNLDDAFRNSNEYREWMKAIDRDYPTMPIYLREMAMIAHLDNPQAYKQHLKNKTPAPTRKPPSTSVIEGAITISLPEEKEEHNDQDLLPEP